MIDDKQLQKNILAELDWDASVNAAHIGVTVHDGIATLAGHVPSYREKLAAESVTRRVKGVRAIAQEIEVKLPSSAERSDEDIAGFILSALRWQSGLHSDKIKVEVEKGVVTLFGELDWNYQRELTGKIARGVLGVRAVINNITIKPSVKPSDVKLKIEQALKRNAELEASHVNVSASDDTVTLTGRVRSWYEREMAERAAWSAPGVKRVVDEVVVGN